MMDSISGLSCTFCQKYLESSSSSKWKTINDLNALNKFWYELNSSKDVDCQSYQAQNSSKLCLDCHPIWKQWKETCKMLDKLLDKKQALLEQFKSIISIPSSSLLPILSHNDVKMEITSDTEEDIDDIFLPSQYTSICVEPNIDVSMKFEDELETPEKPEKFIPGDVKQESETEDDEEAGSDLEEDEEIGSDFEDDEEDDVTERNQKSKKPIICEFCEKSFCSYSSLCNHIETKHKSKKKLHSCSFPSCDKKYATIIQRDEHFRIHLQSTCKVQLSCRFCSKVFTTLNRREIHERKSHNHDGGPRKSKNPLACNICGKIFPTLSNVRIHEKRSHGQKLSCELCPPDIFFTSQEKLLNHICKIHETDSSTKFIKCPKCLKSFATKFMCKRHFNGHYVEEDRPLSCSICERRYSLNDEDKLEHHFKIHTKGYERTAMKIKKCKLCPKEFDSKQVAILYEHERRHHPELLVHACEFCDKRYSARVLYETHLKTHDPKGPYVCLVCHSRYGPRVNQGGFPFESGETLANHLKRHSGENYKVCKICNSNFQQENALLHHMSKVHGAERQFACNLCEKRYPAPNDLSTHVRIVHEQREKPQESQKCEECSLTFPSRPALRQHIRRIHRQSEKRLCNLCGKVLRSPIALRDHINMHKGIKNFACTFCDKRFVRKEDIRVHNLTHTGEKPHKCYICSKGFTQRHSLKTHLKMHEKNGTWVPEQI